MLPERLRRIAAPDLFVALELAGGFDAELLERAAVALVGRHEVLRTVYPDDRRVPYQKVLVAPESVVETIRLPAAADLAVALRADAAHRFDLVREIPVRIRRYVLAERDVLSVTVHPVAADDRTLELVVAELLGDASASSAPYRDFAMAQVKTLTVEDDDLAYWTERLAGLPDRATPVSDSGADATARTETDPIPALRRRFRVSAEGLSALVADAEHTDVFAALTARAAHEVGLGVEVAVGVADRAHAGSEALGNYANYLVLRLNPTAGRTPRQLIGAATEARAQAQRHAGTRIERLTHQLWGAAAVINGALFQVLVRVRATVEFGGQRGGSEASVRELVRRGARPHGVDVVVDVVTDADGATVVVEFPERPWGGGDIDAFTALLARLVGTWSAGVDDPTAEPSATVTLFSRAELFSGEAGLGGPPDTEEERVIADAIRAVLELDADDEVGRADTFFSLGGDSIAALRMVTSLAEQGYALDVQQVFEFPAIQDLAAQLSSADSSGPAESVPEVAPMAASGLDPATLAALGKNFSAR
ncbi:hypothetical protein GCM10023318_55390 [Nocardia callitridis]|uniref:Carrier domain-containing protein n=1 Tax=Nocardia callitridis TaxID=648753 RepID=A0ABP9KVU0_9NOCA